MCGYACVSNCVMSGFVAAYGYLCASRCVRASYISETRWLNSTQVGVSASLYMHNYRVGFGQHTHAHTEQSVFS